MAKCILCNNKATANVQNNASRTIYNCQSCGVFVVSDLVTDEVKQYAGELAAYFTHRKLEGLSEVVLITFEKANKDKDYSQLTVSQILEQHPNSFSRVTDRILENLSALSHYCGEEIKVEGLDMCPVFYAKKQNYDALSFMIKSMQKFDLIEVNYYGSSFFPCGVVVGPKGWERLAEITEGCAMPDCAFLYLSGNEGPLGDSFRSVARKVAREQGYRAVEMGAGDHHFSDRVTLEVLAGVRNARFTVCCLGDAAGSSYYVAGMSRAMGKPTILTCHQSLLKKLKIDPEQLTVLSWTDEKDLYLQIQSAIRALV
jgi:hypothetical protein